ncbi:ABC transporter ATP-binding protein [Streptomyces sp. AB3(2024)]|uniref:ABC transporter ATP-binding protein n=1 Tax=Streptomyces sp. AB3(2024) TaxID=3317321 RepID=UPI0035A30D69
MDVATDRAGTVPALDARELYRFYRSGEEETLALRGVSLTVAPGELVAVVGPSGSGKSTLLACLAGLDEPAGGSVRIAGERISHRPEAERAGVRARRIGILLQTENLIAHLDVARNIRLARTAAGRHAPPAAGRHATPAQDIDVLLDQVGLLGRAHALPRELAGGELARAALAVALANDPDLLLADEPTGELDGSTEHRVLELLRARGSDGRRGVLLVTHSTAVVAGADRVLTLRDGRLRP